MKSSPGNLGKADERHKSAQRGTDTPPTLTRHKNIKSEIKYPSQFRGEGLQQKELVKRTEEHLKNVPHIDAAQQNNGAGGGNNHNIGPIIIQVGI